MKLLCPLPLLPPVGEIHCPQPMLKIWGLKLPFLEEGVSSKLFGVLFHQRSVLSPLFIYLFIYLFNHYFTVLWTRGYVLYTWGYNPINIFLYFVALASESSFSWLRCPFAVTLPVGFSFVFFEHFLTFWHYEMLQAYPVYFLPSPRSSHFSRGPWFPSLGQKPRPGPWALPGGRTRKRERVHQPACTLVYRRFYM